VRLLAPAGPSTTVSDLLTLPPATGTPFAAGPQATLAHLSTLILQHPRLRADAASVALAYWLRRSNLDRLAQAFERRRALEPETVFVPVGRVFHVAPGNVDTMFIYSWALSYLCGNQNIVRVSGQNSEVLAHLLSLLSSLMQENEELAAGNRFITYEHDQAVSAALSEWATHRTVWGGDDTVKAFRALPMSPHASERAFASKFSYSVLSAATYLRASPLTAEKLAAGFFNDLFWFDQLACSSPHLVIWAGSPEQSDSAIRRFDTELEKEIERRGYESDPSHTMHRLNYVFNLSCDADLTVDLTQKQFLSVRLLDGHPWRKEICGGGLFMHVRVENLADIATIAEQRDQTVTHFGFSREELELLAQAGGGRGVDRYVPIGDALAFDVIWDGYDLVGDFLRRVTVRMGKYDSQQ